MVILYLNKVQSTACGRSKRELTLRILRSIKNEGYRNLHIQNFHFLSLSLQYFVLDINAQVKGYPFPIKTITL